MKREVKNLFDSMTGGMAAILSAYLLALATNLVSPEGQAIYAAYLSAFSLVCLVLYRILSVYELRGNLIESTPVDALGILFAVGLTGASISFLVILSIVDMYLPLVVLFTFGAILSCFIFFFESPKKSPTGGDEERPH